MLTKQEKKKKKRTMPLQRQNVIEKTIRIQPMKELKFYLLRKKHRKI